MSYIGDPRLQLVNKFGARFVKAVTFKVLLINIVVFIVSCSKQEETVSYTMPYYAGCEDTVEKAAEMFSRSTRDKNYKLRIEVSKFDFENRYFSTDVKGTVTLISKGKWKTLSGKSPLEYLKLEANGISFDCMPNNYQIVPIDEVKHYYSKIGAKNVIPKFLNKKEMILYFNDGHYKYMQPAN